MKNLIQFISSEHENNYLTILSKFTKNIDKNLDIALRLLTLEEVFTITKDYITEIGINFNDLLIDSRLESSKIFICQLAQSFYLQSFTVNSFSSTRKLHRYTREYIINILYSYIPKSTNILTK